MQGQKLLGDRCVMKRLIAAAVLVATALTGSACSGTSETEQQVLVDRATLTLQEMVTTNVSHDPRDLLRRARGVMICPRVFKAGFLFGGSGGGCVLLARAGNGTWSYPAFYSIGSGSFGLQAGLQDSQVLLLIMTRRGLNAVLDSQIKLGASAGLAIATFGGGVQADTTAAVGADIIAFAASRGLFAGISLEGSVMSTDTHGDQLYYGRPYAARQIVMDMQGVNPGADPLRELLTRYGGPGAPAGYAQPSAYSSRRPGYAPPYPPAQPGYAPYPAPAPNGQPAPLPAGRGPVQEQTLAPPR
jgi:lipid-binding SYLF domain-containing protein